MSTKRIKLVVQYDGYDFFGWARQPELRTVRETLEQSVRQVSGEANEIIGASRTDSGAHALGQVCHFDTAQPIPNDGWVRALNDLLPPDLAVRKANVVHPEFHSRFWAHWRHYRYRIGIGKKDPLHWRFRYEGGRELDLAPMAQAAQALVGRHDFRAFSQEMAPEANTVREVLKVQVRAGQDEVWIDVVGQAFLRGMMRRIAGALWLIGRGRREVDFVPTLLQVPDSHEVVWPPVLPAHGLTLMHISYGRHPREQVRNKQVNEGNDDE